MAPGKLGRPHLKALLGSRLAVLVIRAAVVEVMVRACLTVDDFAELVAIVEPLSPRTVRSDLALRDFLRNRAVDVPMPLRRIGLYWSIFGVLAREPYGSPPCTALMRVIDDALTDEELNCYHFIQTPSGRARFVPEEPSRKYQHKRQALAHYLRSLRRISKERFATLLREQRTHIVTEAASVRRAGISYLAGMDEGERVSREWAIRYAGLAATLHLRSRHTAAGLLRHTSYASTPFTGGEVYLWKHVRGVGLGGAPVDHINHLRIDGETYIAVPRSVIEGTVQPKKSHKTPR